MDKYQLLISKIKKLKSQPSNFEDKPAASIASNFTPSELALMEEVLETIQVLEIIFRLRAKKNQPKEHV